MTSLAWLAASSRAALCCWANSFERPPGLPETPGCQLGLPALLIFYSRFALKLGVAVGRRAARKKYSEASMRHGSVEEPSDFANSNTIKYWAASTSTP